MVAVKEAIDAFSRRLVYITCHTRQHLYRHVIALFNILIQCITPHSYPTVESTYSLGDRRDDSVEPMPLWSFLFFETRHRCVFWTSLLSTCYEVHFHQRNNVSTLEYFPEKVHSEEEWNVDVGSEESDIVKVDATRLSPEGSVS